MTEIIISLIPSYIFYGVLAVCLLHIDHKFLFGEWVLFSPQRFAISLLLWPGFMTMLILHMIAEEFGPKDDDDLPFV